MSPPLQKSGHLHMEMTALHIFNCNQYSRYVFALKEQNRVNLVPICANTLSLNNLQVLSDNSGDDAHGHTTFHVQTRHGKTDFIFFARSAVVVA